MDELLGVWKPAYMVLGNKRKSVKGDPEMERMRFIFLADGTVKSGIAFDDEVTPEVEKEMKKRGFSYQDGVIVMETKKWKEENGKILSEISSIPESETEYSKFGPVEFEGEYLKIYQLFAAVLLKKE